MTLFLPPHSYILYNVEYQWLLFSRAILSISDWPTTPTIWRNCRKSTNGAFRKNSFPNSICIRPRPTAVFSVFVRVCASTMCRSYLYAYWTRLRSVADYDFILSFSRWTMTQSNRAVYKCSDPRSAYNILFSGKY